MFFFRGLLPGFLLLFAGAAVSQSLSLAEAEQIALAAEPGEAALREHASALYEQAAAAAHLPDPKLRLALANFPLESGGFSTEGMTQMQLGVRQVFPPGKSRSVGSRRYRSMALEADQSAAARLRDVQTAVRTNWLDIYYWNQSGVIVADMRPLFADLAGIAQSLYAVGRRDQQDVLRAELELSRIDDRLLDIGKNRATAKARLSQWIGEHAARPLDDELPRWQSLPSLEQLQQRLGLHPVLLAAEARVSVAGDGVELAQQQNKPGWALDVGYAYRDGRLANGMSRSDFATVGFTVDLPYFGRKRQDSEVAAARNERRAATAARERVIRDLGSRLAMQYAQFTELTRRIEHYETRVLVQAGEHAHAAMAAYQSDTADFADVVLAAVDELNSQVELLRLRVDRARAYVVLANLGGLAQ